MNVVDSSGWLEFFANGPNAAFFEPAIHDLRTLVIPSIVLLEVFKRVFQQRGEEDAVTAITLMQAGHVVSLDKSIALSAAQISLNLKLSIADSVILATARAYEALLCTQDADFKGIERVKYVLKKRVN